MSFAIAERGFLGTGTGVRTPSGPSSRWLVHLAKMTSANIVFEITTPGHPIEILEGIFEAFVGSHIGNLFMSDSNDFPPNINSFTGCFVENIKTISTVIRHSFKKRSVNNKPTGMVVVLADDVIERIRGCSFSKALIPRAFEMLAELEGLNIKGTGWLVRARLVVIDRGIRDH